MRVGSEVPGECPRMRRHLPISRAESAFHLFEGTPQPLGSSDFKSASGPAFGSITEPRLGRETVSGMSFA